jgi:hypothetical protein
VNRAQRLVTLSLKYCRKAEASEAGQVEFGRDGGGLRQRRLSRVFQSFLGCWLQVEMVFRKKVRRAAVISFETILACSLKFVSFCGVLFLLKIVSSLDLLDFSFFISGVMKGLCGRERQEVVFSGACLSRRAVRVEENWSR